MVPAVDASEKSGAVSPGSGIGAVCSDMTNFGKGDRVSAWEFYPAYLWGHTGVKGLARGTGCGIVERTAGQKVAAR